ncbi:MAG: hypothetical protein II521_09675, partial [Prevotella sp.]|nr:hypothetical protein [Prevotella sp.]
MKHILYVISIFLVLTVLASCTDKEAMRQRLDYVSQCNRADTVFTEAWLPTVDSLVNYFDRHGNANEKMMAHYLKGRVHHDMGESPIALECYQQATEMADTTKKDCDLYTLAAIYGQMASLFHSQYLPDNEMNAIIMAEHYAWKDKDTMSAIKAYELRIRPYFLKNETDSMAFVLTRVREKYLQLGEREKAAQVIFPMISILLDNQQLKKASYYLDIYERESRKFDSNEERVYDGEYYYDKGRYMFAIGNIDSARFYFYKAKDRGILEAGYKGLLSVYKKLNKSDSIAKYAELFANANDSSYLHVNQQQIEQVMANFNYSHQRRIAEKKRQEASNLKMGIICMFFIAFMTVSVLLIAFYRFKVKRLQEINDLKRTKENLEMLLMEKDISTEGIKKEVLRLNNKNSNLHKTYKEEIKCLQTQIDTLQQKLHETVQTTDLNPDFEIIISNFKDRFQTYHKDDLPPTVGEWKLFEDAFVHNHTTFYQFITLPHGMKTEHIRVCMMVVLDISESMMAFAMETNGKRIDRLKRQANKKLFREDNASTLKNRLLFYFDNQKRKV